MSGTADEVVLDANVLVGLADDRDVLHARARELYARLDAQGVGMVLVDFLVAEALSVIARRANERGTWALEHDVIVGRFLQADAAGEIRRLAEHGYARLDRVLALVRNTSGRLNTHDAMLVVLQRDGLIDAVATFDAALAATPGFVHTG